MRESRPNIAVAMLLSCFCFVCVSSDCIAQSPVASPSGGLSSGATLPSECREFETPLGLDIGRALRVMRSTDWRMRSKVVRCISFLSQADELLRSVAKDADPRVRRTALFALGEKLVVSPFYAQLLADPDPLVRSLAARYAHLSGVLAVDGLVSIASDKKALLEQRVLAIEGIARLAQQALSVRTSLSGLVSDKEPAIRIAAIKAIGSMGKGAKDVLPSLERRLAMVSPTSLEAAWLKESIVRLDPTRLNTRLKDVKPRDAQSA